MKTHGNSKAMLVSNRPLRTLLARIFCLDAFISVMALKRFALIVVSSILGLTVLLQISNAQTPTPTPITKSDPPTVQTPSTVGRVIKWTGASKNGIGIIGDSVITESSGNIGIDVINPVDKLSVAGAINTTIQYNIGGARVLSAPSNNLFVGFATGNSNTSGTYNSFFGNSAGSANTTGMTNSFFGTFAGVSNISGSSNSFFGAQAGYSNQNGRGNSFFGASAGLVNTSGSSNSFFGDSAGYRSTGSGNSFFGFTAGINNVTGGNNVFFGNRSGQSNTTESNNTFIGANSNGAVGITNATAIGANAVVTQSNTIVLGNNADVVMSRNGTIGGNLVVSGTLVGNGSGLTNLKPANIDSGTAGINITGNAATVTDGVVTTGSYANPSWITSLDGSKITNGGAITDLNANNITSGTLSSDRLGIVSVANGGTGSSIQNFVDISNPQTVGGAKTFTSPMTVSGQLSANSLSLPTGDLAAGAGNTLLIKGPTDGSGTTGGFLSLGPGSLSYPGGTATLSAGATSPDYDRTPGSFIRLTGNGYYDGGDVTIASGHGYGTGAGGVITLNASGAWSGYNPPPGYISFQILGQESMRVASDGKVGVGITNPFAKFHVSNVGGNAGQFDGNVTINGSLNVSGSTNLSANVIHDATLTGNGTISSPLAVQNGVFTTGSYANPSWITSLDGNKITGGTVVKSFNGLSDNVTLSAGTNVSLHSTGNTLTISTNTSRRAALGQWWTTTPRDDINLGTTQLSCCNIQLVASDGADLWVPDGSSSVFRVRASDGKILEQWGAPDGVGVLSAMGRVFVTSQSTNRLYMIDPTQPVGAATMVADSLGNVPTGITFDGSKIWTTNFNGASVSIITPGAGTLWNVQTHSGFVNPFGILYDGNNIWVTDFGDSKLKKLDGNGNIVQSVSVGVQPIFSVFDGKNIWVPNRGSNSISVVRTADATVLATLTGNGLNGPQSAAFDGERILVANHFGDTISLWKASDFTPLGSYSTGAGSKPLSTCSDGINFWITLTGSGKLLRF